jgi:hypothetical protein
MAVCINFNYPRVALSAKAAGTGTFCGTPNTSKVKLIGAGFTPQPFTSLLVQQFTNGLTTSTGRNVEDTAQIDGTVVGWPHVVKAVIVPGTAGEPGVGAYILFGQQIP